MLEMLDQNALERAFPGQTRHIFSVYLTGGHRETPHSRPGMEVQDLNLVLPVERQLHTGPCVNHPCWESHRADVQIRSAPWGSPCGCTGSQACRPLATRRSRSAARWGRCT